MNNHNSRPTAILTMLFLLGGFAACAGPEPLPMPAPAPAPAPQPAAPAPAPEPVTAEVVRPDYPERYVVVKGDTLWDIAERFLKDPWVWPQVWHINPEIQNPHLIYPGDVLTLYFVDGKPVIEVQRGEPAVQRTRLSPQVRVEPIERAIATLPRDIIAPFLKGPRVVGPGELEAAPYVVSSYEEHLITGPGHRIYVRGVGQAPHSAYTIVRLGDAYRRPGSDEILGYEAIHVAEAQLVRGGDPATLDIAQAVLETHNGDRLLPSQPEEIPITFHPRGPEAAVDGHIISVYGGVSEIGQFDVVVVDLGHRDGLEPGHVLAVWQAGPVVRDATAGGEVRLPDERAGVAMVFRTFDRVSYALVMRATRALHVLDRVTNP